MERKSRDTKFQNKDPRTFCGSYSGPWSTTGIIRTGKSQVPYLIVSAKWHGYKIAEGADIDL